MTDGPKSSSDVFQQNVSLEKTVAEQTSELREQGEKLAVALDALRRTQAQLVQERKLEAIGALAAGVAHEINTPTQYVSDNTTFLTRAFDHLSRVAMCATALLASRSPEVSQQALDDLDGAVKKARLDYLLKQIPRALMQSTEGLQRISSIVGAMKEFSHPSAGEKEPVDLAQAIRMTLTVARSEWKYVADVETQFDDSLPHVPGLRDELNQVFLNLIVNAAHAISELTSNGAAGKGKITVRTRREGSWAVVALADTGVGIPEKIRTRIFDPFFTTKAVGKGTGQGLAIAYNVVVDKHGGKIRVESEVDHGSTFEVWLPLVSERRSMAPARGEHASAVGR